MNSIHERKKFNSKYMKSDKNLLLQTSDMHTLFFFIMIIFFIMIKNLIITTIVKIKNIYNTKRLLIFH